MVREGGVTRLHEQHQHLQLVKVLYYSRCALWTEIAGTRPLVSRDGSERFTAISKNFLLPLRPSSSSTEHSVALDFSVCGVIGPWPAFKRIWPVSNSQWAKSNYLTCSRCSACLGLIIIAATCFLSLACVRFQTRVSGVFILFLTYKLYQMCPDDDPLRC